MAGVPGGRGPRQPQDYSEWLDQRVKEVEGLRPLKVRFLRGVNQVVVNAGDMVMVEQPGVVQFPSVKSVPGGRVVIESPLGENHQVTLKPFGQETIEGLTQLKVNTTKGRFTAISDGVKTWHIAASRRPWVGDYCVGGLTVEQTSNLNIGDQVEFDVSTELGDSASLSSTSGNFNLKFGRTYLIQYGVRLTMGGVATDNATLRLREVGGSDISPDAGSDVRKLSLSAPSASSIDSSSFPTNIFYYTPDQDITVELQITGKAGTISQIEDQSYIRFEVVA